MSDRRDAAGDPTMRGSVDILRNDPRSRKRSASHLAYSEEEQIESTEKLILDLLKEDHEEFLKQQTNSNELGKATDIGLSLQMWKDEVQSADQIFEDGVLAVSIANAVASDQHILKNFAEEERTAQRDHQMARVMEEHPNEAPEMPREESELPTNSTTESVCEVISSLGLVTASQDALPAFVGHQTFASVTDHRCNRCVSCTEELSQPSMYLPQCRHTYCIDCLRQLFMKASTDEELYPPRCCANVFPPALAMRLLDYKELAAFSIRGVEFSSKDRVYCADPLCSAFIPPWMIKEQRAQCPNCSQATHTACRALGEPDHDCPSDEALHQVLVLAEDLNWRRCPQCRTMVELNQGCHHMTCRCGKEFCYLCGATWRTCTCELWQEERLLDIAHRIVEDEGEPGAAPEERAEHLARVAEGLRDHPVVACEHGRNAQWKFRSSGNLRCEVCSDLLREYIFECKQCRLRACNACRRNRLR